MANGQASTDIAAVELEKAQDMIPQLLKDEETLDGVIHDNGRATRIGTGSSAGAYRVALKYARPSQYQMGSLDGAALPTGKGSSYDKIYVTPQVLMLPVGWTKLVELVGKKVDQMAITDVVSDTMADAADQLKQVRDQLLQTDGTGKIGVVASATTTVITCQQASFGARLINPGQYVTIWSGTTLYALIQVSAVFNQLGQTPTFAFSNATYYNGQSVTSLNASGLIIRPAGLTDGAPVSIHGLAYVNSTSQSGTYFGVTRSSAPYVVAPGFDAGASQISLPALRLIINMVKSKLGSKGLKGQCFHTHDSQVAAYEELGFERQTLPLADGKAKGIDLLYSGKKTVADYAVLDNTNADQTAWDFVQPKAWGRVMYGDGPFWYEAGNAGRIYPLYSSSGTPLTEFGATLVDAYDMYDDNVWAGGRISNLKVPAAN